MSSETVDWSLPLAILAVGLVLGALFVWLARRRAAPALSAGAPELELRDLGGRRDSLVAQLRELDATRAKLSREQAERAQAALELELAKVLKAIDERNSGRAQRALSTAAPRSAGVNPVFKGFLWGAASATAVFALFFWVARVAEPRREGGSVTGEIPMPGGAQAATSGTDQPASDEEQALQARVAKDPGDLEARIGLAQAALGRNDMMAVWNQTRYVLQQKPGEPHALAYQALVRVAMGQPEMAVPMLQQAIKTQPDFADAYLHLALAYLRLGRAKDADQIVATAKKRFPADSDQLDQFYAQMRARVKPGTRAAPGAQMAEGPAPGPDNPHAGVDASGAAGSSAPATSSAPQAAAAPAAGRRITGTIVLDPALQGQLAPGGVLFVFARPAGVAAGPPAAAKRLQPSSFPLRFELSDADSMMGGELPPALRIEARLDADGDARTHDAQDLKGVLDNVALGTSGLELVLTH